MKNDTIQVKSISQIHKAVGLPKPAHPLISLIDAAKISVGKEALDVKLIYEFYSISYKDHSHGIKYGRNTFDFEEGMMVFSAPGQVYTPIETIEAGDMQGWILYFHPDLIRNTSLSNEISEYSFFNYDVFEALHLSAKEEEIILSSIDNIVSEYNQRIDNHSQRVIVSNLALLLNYCLRFYERQFNTRVTQNKDIVANFEKQLFEYYRNEKQLEKGIPPISFFAQNATLSQHYFSDLIKKETGRTPTDHINQYVINRAKALLIETNLTVSEIAYQLGFNYPHYFTRLFKTKTGTAPTVYRKVS